MHWVIGETLMFDEERYVFIVVTNLCALKDDNIFGIFA
jgi:hypothetical protein